MPTCWWWRTGAGPRPPWPDARLVGLAPILAGPAVRAGAGGGSGRRGAAAARRFAPGRALARQPHPHRAHGGVGGHQHARAGGGHIGTSAPEPVTTLCSTWRGERDVAIGNLIGSSICNILMILGLCGADRPKIWLGAEDSNLLPHVPNQPLTPSGQLRFWGRSMSINSLRLPALRCAYVRAGGRDRTSGEIRPAHPWSKSKAISQKRPIGARYSGLINQAAVYFVSDFNPLGIGVVLVGK